MRCLTSTRCFMAVIIAYLAIISLSCSSNEDYKVYSALINEYIETNNKGQYDTIMIVSNTDSAAHWRPEMKDVQDTKVLETASSLPIPSQEAIQGYLKSNRKSYPLKNRFDLTLKPILVSSTFAAKFIRAEPGKAGFREKYPKVMGIIRLSRVGYSASHSEAYFYIESWRDNGLGGGALIQAKLNNGLWQRGQHIFTWLY